MTPTPFSFVFFCVTTPILLPPYVFGFSFLNDAALHHSQHFVDGGNILEHFTFYNAPSNMAVAPRSCLRTGGALLTITTSAIATTTNAVATSSKTSESSKSSGGSESRSGSKIEDGDSSGNTDFTDTGEIEVRFSSKPDLITNEVSRCQFEHLQQKCSGSSGDSSSSSSRSRSSSNTKYHK